MHTEYYELLGVPPGASAREIKKAYRANAKKCHPDLHPSDPGAEEKFKKLSKAYEVLSDPEKRKHYDRFGDDESARNAEQFPDVFNSFFGNFGGMHMGTGVPQPRRRKGQSIVHELPVRLEDIYTGRRIKLKVQRNEICGKCSGTGMDVEESARTDESYGPKASECRTCGGTGQAVRMQQIGPMVQQTIQACTTCRGSGQVVPENLRCKQCAGRKVQMREKVLDVNVEPGAEHGKQYLFRGESHQHPDFDEPGDIMIRIAEKPHEIFRRKDMDLHVDLKISLYEALAGTRARIRHLDGSLLHARTAAFPTQIISPGDTQILLGRGMAGPGHRRGNMVLHFDVEFPKADFTSEQLLALKEHLPVGDYGKYDDIPDSQMVDMIHQSCVPSSGSATHSDQKSSDPPEDGENVQCVHQ